MAQKRAAKGNASSKKSTKLPKSKLSNGTSKMTLCTVPTVTPHSPTRERRTDRRIIGGKRLAMVRAFPGKVRASVRRSLDPCDNSNDSGLGFDNHVADHRTNLSERLTLTAEHVEAKRPRLDIKLEDDEINDSFSFPDAVRMRKDNMSIIRTTPSSATASLSLHSTQNNTGNGAVPRCTALTSRPSSSQPVTLTSQLANVSRESNINLRIISQPEQQHRARYQTEGSRGAVKDRSGNGFPVVQLVGYHKPATLQVFIGTDVGKPNPHMFYQACRVSGKNSTPCMEKKLEGTVVIELQLDPTKDMIGTCDCVGILKERNVDVEHRFPDQIGSRSKKKSTRCRMVFRTSITHDNGIIETLQVCSQPIVCTQPPGIPEICKKSLTSCPATGGLELFILGKNFLKDTKVFFQQVDDQGLHWEHYVVPDKEFLQQTHLVCVIPPYARTDITEPVTVRLLVVSSGKTSEPHQFVYTPTNVAASSVHAETTQSSSFTNKVIWSSVNKHEQGIMPPPDSNQMPLSQRRPSINTTSPEIHSPPLHSLKQELIDENSQNSMMDSLEMHRERFRHISESSLDVQHGDSTMTMINENSMDILRQGSVSLDSVSSNINENTMNDAILRHNSQNMHENGINVSLVNPPTTCITENSMLVTPTSATGHSCTDLPDRDQLSVIDLRMKMPPATVADLANTNAPSMATLHSFGITEATNAPLLAQTAQSIENYLSTIETKPVNVDTMAFSSNLQLPQIFSAPQISRLSHKLMNNQVMSPTNLLDTTNTQNLSHLGAIASNFNSTQSTLLPVRSVSLTNGQVILQQNGLINDNVNLLQTTMEDNVLSNINSALNATRDGGIHTPQDMLLRNKSPLIPNSSTQDLLLNTTSQSTLLMSPVLNTSMTSSVVESTDVNTTHNTSTISPEIILNSQISPTMMCHTSNALNQDVLLSSICQSNTVAETAIVQTQMAISESVPQQTTLLAAEAPLPSAQPTVNLTNQLNSAINTSEPEKVILLKAAVDLYETQKKINELETLAANSRNNNIEQAIMNNILSSSPPRDSNQLNRVNTLQQRKQNFIVPVSVKDIAGQIQNEKKNEDRMIPTGFTTMSENELINIINPSCFDQGNTFH
ncbi:hypothetical protein FQA39_LY11179 [Lamprigera yunnana]|nr:hypothetical protein FQA39_LY11179 [Lamprigera yunnana]